jgi:hypothetical protein
MGGNDTTKTATVRGSSKNGQQCGPYRNCARSIVGSALRTISQPVERSHNPNAAWRPIGLSFSWGTNRSALRTLQTATQRAGAVEDFAPIATVRQAAMEAPTEQIDFVAVLIYDDGPRRRGIEAHVFRAAHPEIAYQCAIAKGAEKRYGRRLVGLAELAVKTGEAPTIGKTEGGDARELVVPKERLSAFQDPRWSSTPHDPAALEAALRGPPLLADLPGLNDVDWGSLSHAYGAASDVPLDLKRVASC